MIIIVIIVINNNKKKNIRKTDIDNSALLWQPLCYKNFNYAFSYFRLFDGYFL